MAVNPDAFDVPVVDYDFTKATSPRSLIEQMARAGGFTATKFALARSILNDMRSESDAVGGDASKVTNWLSFPACLCATGTRGFFVEAIKRKMFNVVSTTCGTRWITTLLVPTSTITMAPLTLTMWNLVNTN